MEEREFAKYAFLIVAVVAVVGLLTSGGGLTGFATKVGLKAPTISCEKAKQMVANYCKDNAKLKQCKDAEKVAANVCKAKPARRPAPRPAQQSTCTDNENYLNATGGINLTVIAGNITFFNGSDGSTRTINDECVYDRSRILERVCEGNEIRVIRNVQGDYLFCNMCGQRTHNGACEP